MNFQENVIIVGQVALSNVQKWWPQEEKHHVPLEDLIYSQVSFINEQLRVGAHISVFTQVHVHVPLMDIAMRKNITFGSINLKMPKNKIFQRSALPLMVHQKHLVMSYFLKRNSSVMMPLPYTSHIYNHDNELSIVISISHMRTQVQATQLVSVRARILTHVSVSIRLPPKYPVPSNTS